QLEADGRSEHTIAQYRRHLFYFARWLSETARTKAVITPEVVAAFFISEDARASCRGGAKRPTTLNAMRSSLRGFFAYCRDAGLTRENPARLLRRAVCGTPPPRFLSPADEARLLAVIDAAAARGDASA